MAAERVAEWAAGVAAERAAEWAAEGVAEKAAAVLVIGPVVALVVAPVVAPLVVLALVWGLRLRMTDSQQGQKGLPAERLRLPSERGWRI